MIGVTVDISELKRAEQERRELSARLQRAQDEERRRAQEAGQASGQPAAPQQPQPVQEPAHA